MRTQRTPALFHERMFVAIFVRPGGGRKRACSKSQAAAGRHQSHFNPTETASPKVSSTAAHTKAEVKLAT